MLRSEDISISKFKWANVKATYRLQRLCPGITALLRSSAGLAAGDVGVVGGFLVVGRHFER